MSRWWHDAVIYSLGVETFCDGNGDGIGDFAGLRRRMDHLVDLGVTCAWLLPFLKSPRRDYGYDVADYYAIDPRYGDFGDFIDVMRTFRDNGIHVLFDLVVNHTSIDHPWFQSARADAKSPYRDYYIWAEEPPRNNGSEVIYPGEQRSTWTFDQVAGAWYFHHFYEHQPELNIENPAVRHEIDRIMTFWLELGVSGFRIDAAPFVIEHVRPSGRKGKPCYAMFREMRKVATRSNGDAVLIAEANVEEDDLPNYFADGAGLQVLFDFMTNQALFVALAEHDARPLRKRFHDHYLHESEHWAQFVRNHDELDLGRLSHRERDKVFAAFAPDPRMQIYGRGIRRRFASMLEGDVDRISMGHSLSFSFPGTPVVRYGEEIGMGEDLERPGRMAVRTPMEWERVTAQRNDPSSLLSRIRELVRLRRRHAMIGRSSPKLVEVDNDHVFAHRYDNLLIVHNLAPEPVRVQLAEYGELALGRYGYRWLDV